MKSIHIPAGFRFERLDRRHPRRLFVSGEPAVDDWLRTKALQHQSKHLSVTTVLLDNAGLIVGYHTLATGQVDFTDLPAESSKHLPRRILPVAVLAWLGVSASYQKQGLGTLLLAHALRDCWQAGKTFPFVAVILDCVKAAAKAFYCHWDFKELPGHPFRLFVSAQHLDALMKNS